MKVSNGTLELDLTEYDISDIIIEPTDKKETMGLIRALIEEQAGGKLSAEQLDAVANDAYAILRSRRWAK